MRNTKKFKKAILLTTLGAFILLPRFGTAEPISSQLGLVDFNGPSGDGCLATDNQKLKVGAKIELVIFEDRKMRDPLSAQIVEGQCQMGRGTKDILSHNKSNYRFKIGKVPENLSDYKVGIGILNFPKSETILDVDGDKKPEEFRECTSSEGIHYRVISSKTHKALWSEYYYLGYDVEADCKEGELREGEG